MQLQLRLQLQWLPQQQLLQLLLVQARRVPASPARWCQGPGWVRVLLLMRLLLQAALRMACNKRGQQTHRVT
jgi:hypothetical protein